MKKKYLIFLALIIAMACGQQASNNSTENVEINEAVTSTETEEEIVNTYIKDGSEGSKYFLLCVACHSLKEGETNKVGPNLYGFFGSKAGTREGFKYTQNLIDSGIVWDRENLRKWIENPAAMVPSTSMAFVGLKEKDRQDALMDYILKYTQ